MMFLLSFAISFIAATLAYNRSRAFVRTRLRFVDAVQSPLAPILAGLGAAVAIGIFTFLPLIGAGTALSVGLATGMGVASGAKDAKNGYYLAD